MDHLSRRRRTLPRPGSAEAHYLVVVHHLAGALWARGAGIQALGALTDILRNHDRPPGSRT